MTVRTVLPKVALSALACLTACAPAAQRRNAPLPPPPVTAERAPAKASVLGGKAAEFCAALRAKAEYSAPKPFRSCWATRSGAWALLFEPVDQGPAEDGVVGEWSIVHVDVSGVEVRVTPVGSAEYVTECDQPGCLISGDIRLEGREEDSTFSAEAFDWDDDGEAELYVEIGYRSPTRQATRGRVWTFKNDAITEYAPTAELRIRSLQDFDMDGRPDFFVDHVGTAPACSTRHPLELVHALPRGALANDDAMTREYERKRCH